jgi:hypothetical protein
LTAAQAHARSSFVVGRSSKKEKTFTTKAQRHQGRRGDAIFRRGGPLRPPGVIPATSGRPESDGARAFLAPSALFGDAWAARRKASPPLALIHIFLNSKFRIQNLKFLRLSSARPVASPRPSGLRKALASTTHRANHTLNSKLTTLNSQLKTEACPLSLVTPAASAE